MTLDGDYPVDAAALPVNPQEGQTPLAWWGAWLFVATEAMLFASLLSSYFYVRFETSNWPPTTEGAPELLLPSIGTVVLLSSSAVAHWGESGGRRGDTWRLRAGMWGTVALGAVFLTIQLLEYGELPFTPQSHVYGSLFFGITGFHGLHVLVGLVMLVLVATVGWRRGHHGGPAGGGHLPVRVAILYWHFVDVVWISVFGSLYLAEAVM